MFARKGFVSHLGRAAMIAGVAATVLTSVGPSVAFAAPAAKEKGLTAAGTSGATDFSAQRRYYRGGYYRGGGAAAAAFAGIVGTGIAIAAANSRRDYYDDSYGYYGGGPAYYPAPTYYYGGDPAYYGGYYGGYRSGVPTYRGHPLASW